MKKYKVGSKITLGGSHPYAGQRAQIVAIEYVEAMQTIGYKVKLIELWDHECYIFSIDDINQHPNRRTV